MLSREKFSVQNFLIFLRTAYALSYFPEVFHVVHLQKGSLYNSRSTVLCFQRCWFYYCQSPGKTNNQTKNKVKILLKTQHFFRGGKSDLNWYEVQSLSCCLLKHLFVKSINSCFFFYATYFFNTWYFFSYFLLKHIFFFFNICIHTNYACGAVFSQSASTSYFKIFSGGPPKSF